MKSWSRALTFLAAFLGLVLALVPSTASAQATASIAGLVTDASGAVLPGVTVEAASPALIEKVRTVVTDGSGQYRLEQLRGGVYTVTFTLPGFNTVKREGLELAVRSSATVNAEMRVGVGRGDRDGDRRIADRRHPEREPPAGDQPGTAGSDSDRPHAPGGGVHDSWCQSQQRGRGRHQHHQHHRRLDVDPRRRRRRHPDTHRRHHHRQRRGHGVGRQHAAQHGQHAGSGGGLLVGERREHHRRPADQHDPEDRRQPVRRARSSPPP